MNTGRFGDNNRTLATINPQRHITNRDPQAGPGRENPEAPKDAHGKKWRNKKDRISHDEASRRHWHESHDRNWWHDHCDTIVFVTTGYYFLDGSYWYPAYGYDPLQTYYDYDGPIYTYGNLLPDEVIANVQTALQDAGYYYGPVTGSLMSIRGRLSRISSAITAWKLREQSMSRRSKRWGCLRRTTTIIFKPARVTRSGLALS